MPKSTLLKLLKTTRNVAKVNKKMFTFLILRRIKFVRI